MRTVRILRGLLDVILPSSCSYCNGPVGDSGIAHFCRECWGDFAMISGPLCPCCGKPFGSPASLEHSPDHVCGECRRRPPKFDQALAVGQFEGPLREAIHQFKYRPCRSLGRPLGEWFAQNIRILPRLEVAIPVPLHGSRLRQRGFNQALLLAHHLHEKHGISLSFDNLVRMRRTMPQVELSAEERIKNVADAFALRRPDEIYAKNVVIVDDVFTTGATMNECASVLKAAGAAEVVALTLARTLL